MLRSFFSFCAISCLQFSLSCASDFERDFIRNLPDGNIRWMCNTCPPGKPLQEHLSHRLEEDFDVLFPEVRNELLQAISDLQSLEETHNDSLNLAAMLDAEKQILPSSQEMIDKFKGIHAHLNNISQHSNVHILDAYVFGPEGKISDLLEIGKFYDLDSANLSLLQVGQQMTQFLQDNSFLFENYDYEGTAQTQQQIITIIQAHFNNMDAEIAGICPQSREVWSRAWTLASILYQAYGDFYPIKCIFDQVCEGHLTNGGCIQGRVVRGFVGYVMLLGRAGVGAYLR